MATLPRVNIPSTVESMMLKCVEHDYATAGLLYHIYHGSICSHLLCLTRLATFNAAMEFARNSLRYQTTDEVVSPTEFALLDVRLEIRFSGSRSRHWLPSRLARKQCHLNTNCTTLGRPLNQIWTRLLSLKIGLTYSIDP